MTAPFHHHQAHPHCKSILVQPCASVVPRPNQTRIFVYVTGSLHGVRDFPPRPSGLQTLKSKVLQLVLCLDGCLAPSAPNVSLQALLFRRNRPDRNAMRPPSNVHDNTRNVIALLRLKSLTDQGQHCLHPVLIQIFLLAGRNLQTPFASVAQLFVLPLRPDAVLKQAVRMARLQTRRFQQVVEQTEDTHKDQDTEHA